MRPPYVFLAHSMPTSSPHFGKPKKKSHSKSFNQTKNNHNSKKIKKIKTTAHAKMQHPELCLKKPT